MPNYVGAHTNPYTGTLASGNTLGLREGCLAFRITPGSGATVTVAFGMSAENVPAGTNFPVKTGQEVITAAAEFLSDVRTAGFGPVEITTSGGSAVVSCDYRADASPERSTTSDPFTLRTGFTVDHDIGS